MPTEKPVAASVSRAETVRSELGYGPRADAARAALDSLLADRDRYRKALEEIDNYLPARWAGAQQIAREALSRG